MIHRDPARNKLETVPAFESDVPPPCQSMVLSSDSFSGDDELYIHGKYVTA